jgi:hypothetical protein
MKRENLECIKHCIMAYSNANYDGESDEGCELGEENCGYLAVCFAPRFFKRLLLAISDKKLDKYLKQEAEALAHEATGDSK